MNTKGLKETIPKSLDRKRISKGLRIKGFHPNSSTSFEDKNSTEPRMQGEMAAVTRILWGANNITAGYYCFQSQEKSESEPYVNVVRSECECCQIRVWMLSDPSVGTLRLGCCDCWHSGATVLTLGCYSISTRILQHQHSDTIAPALECLSITAQTAMHFPADTEA